MAELLANEYRVLYESADTERVYAYTPGICRLESGRLVASIDQGGPGVADLEGPKGLRGFGKNAWQGIVWTSDDHGATWVEERAFRSCTHDRLRRAIGCMCSDTIPT